MPLDPSWPAPILKGAVEMCRLVLFADSLPPGSHCNPPLACSCDSLSCFPCVACLRQPTMHLLQVALALQAAGARVLLQYQCFRCQTAFWRRVLTCPLRQHAQRALLLGSLSSQTQQIRQGLLLEAFSCPQFQLGVSSKGTSSMCCPPLGPLAAPRRSVGLRLVRMHPSLCKVLPSPTECVHACVLT